MWRIRILRILLPVVLLVFVTAVALEWQPPEGVHSARGRKRDDAMHRGRDIKVMRLSGVEEDLSATVREYTLDAEGHTHLQDVQDFKLARENHPPLVIASSVGEIWGEPGARLMHFARGVTIEDPENGLTVRIPSLDVDESDSKAKSDDQVELSGDSLGGTARGLVYGLEDEPTELRHVDLEDDLGATLSADLALLHDGLDDIELLDDVRVRRTGQTLDADRVRLRRSAGVIRRIVAEGDVRGSALQPDGQPFAFTGDAADLTWEDGDLPAETRLAGRVELLHGAAEMRCESLDLVSRDAGGYDATARGGVWLRGPFGGEEGTLRSDALEARLTTGGLVDAADAFGRVEFIGQATRGEANRARYESADQSLHLTGSSSRKARIARDRIRVAAETISTDTRGRQLDADRSVEATLLPAGRPAVARGLFRDGETIHFVAERLRARDHGAQLEFRDAVRGWQGNRSLAAVRIDVDQERRTLSAQGDVHSRLPRQEASAVSVADFVEILADRLDYDEGLAVARYQENVRMVLDEGWLESTDMEVELDPSGAGAVREVRASGGVDLEFRSAASPESDDEPRRIRGRADRVRFLPAEQTLLLFGDTEPARVTDVEGQAGETQGRVLRYHLETGALEVESGAESPARIKGRRN